VTLVEADTGINLNNSLLTALLSPHVPDVSILLLAVFLSTLLQSVVLF